MNIGTLLFLAETLSQSCELGNHDLDVDIWMAINRPDVAYETATSYKGIWFNGSVETILDIDGKLEVSPYIPNYTTSYDDAIKLFVKMLPEWRYNPVNDYCGYYRADLVSPEYGSSSTGETMPLAICAATLKGIAEELKDA